MGRNSRNDWVSILTKSEKSEMEKLQGQIEKIVAAMKVLRKEKNKIQNRATNRAAYDVAKRHRKPVNRNAARP